MIIACPYCESKIDGKVVGEHVYYDEEYHPVPEKTLLLECPICKHSLVGCHELYQTGPNGKEWSDIVRLWPEPDKRIAWSIPDIVRDSLDEANKCYRGRAFSACAVMCGRALEGICNKYNTKSKILANGLGELLDMKIIDHRLFQWGEELRKHRNIGAHATGEKISKEEARDLLDFVNAICEYVFVLADKFEKFMQRKGQNPAT